MPINYESLKNATASMRNIVIAIAVTVGGLWTAYTFRTLGTSERAQFERQKVEFDLAVEKAAQERQANSGLDLALEASQTKSADGTDYYVEAQVRITNRGTRSKVIDLDGATLNTAEVWFDETGKSGLYNERKGVSLLGGGYVLRPGGTQIVRSSSKYPVSASMRCISHCRWTKTI